MLSRNNDATGQYNNMTRDIETRGLQMVILKQLGYQKDLITWKYSSSPE